MSIYIFNDLLKVVTLGALTISDDHEQFELCKYNIAVVM